MTEVADPTAAASVTADGAVRSAAPPPVPGPERPELLAGVRPLGQMTESAYRDPPWLIDREDRGYLQVTELVHRIAERCDGRRSIDEIAADISRAGEPVKPETVRRLIDQMLVPAAVVKPASGSPVPPAAAARSPLQISLRARMLGPRVINPITAVFTPLFWPPVAITLVAAALATRIWLYTMHGVAQPARDALYHPATLGILLLLIVASAGFHEFGHASALRYGGGNVRAMGVGFYLVYPVVYTDVTENYRLKRGARLRTDLGGFYFNLIASLAVTAAYAMTRNEFLLVFLLLTDLEILQQTLPFVRLDGYWALSDLTGVPDLFTATRSYWSHLLHRALPPERDVYASLKRWGKAVVAVYSLVTIPVLAVLLFLILEAVPRVLATAWDSGTQQLASLQNAAGHADFLGAASHAGQLILLCLPAAAVSVMVIRLAWRFQRRIWGWASGSIGKKAVALVATVAAVCCLGFMWAPRQATGAAGGVPGLGDYVPIQPTDQGTVGSAAAGWGAAAAPATGLPSGAAPTPGATPTPASQPTSQATTAPTAAPTATPQPSSAPPSATP